MAAGFLFMYAFIDYSNLAHAIWYTILRDFGAAANIEAATERMAGKIRSISSYVPHCELIVVLDNPPAHKIALYPDYKKDRGVPVEAIGHLVEWAKHAHRTVSSPDNEADDVIATLVAQTDQAFVIGCDKDLWQLMNGKVKIFNPIQKKFVGPDDVSKAFFGLNADKIPLFKACWGDECDNVPNAFPRMQRQLIPIIKTAKPNWDSFSEQMYQKFNSLTKRCQELYFLHEYQAELNYRIVKLATDCKLIWH